MTRLHAARLERGLTYQQIADMTEEHGEAVSLSTVRRVFSVNADPASFRPYTLATLAAVLLTDSHQRPEETTEEELCRLREEVHHLRTHEQEVMAQAQTMVQAQIDHYLSAITAERRSAYRWFRRRVVLILVSFPTSLLLDVADYVGLLPSFG